MVSSVTIGPLPEPFERGRRLRVPIVVELQQPTKVRGIRARFRAAEETKADYTDTHTDADGKTQTQTKTAVETTEFAAEDFPLAGAGPLGFFGNIKDGLATMLGGGQHETLPAGTHAFDVEISVPADGRPSFGGKKFRVFYELSAQVDIPLASDLWATQEFILLPPPGPPPIPAPVRVRYPDEVRDQRGLLDSMFGSNVSLDVALRADKFRLGETIEGMLGVQTVQPLKCRSVRVRLLGIESTRAHAHADSVRYLESALEIDQPGEIHGDYVQRFSLPAEAQGPLSARGDRFSVDWFVQVELDVPWSTDPSLRVPIELWPR